MTISYPLALPNATGIAKATFRARSVVGVSQSPFTGQAQIQAYAGQWWEAEITLPPMTRAQAEAWIAWWVSLNGREGTFLMGDPSAATPRGSIPGSPVVAGAGQTGRTLATSGWTPSQSGVLLAGDYFQLGTGAATHWHKVLTDANSDGSGAATLDIWPALRASPGDGDQIIVSNTVGLFRMASNEMGWDIDEAVQYGVVFACAEAL